MTEDVRDEMREVFLILGNPDRERAFDAGLQAATESAEARYLPVIEKLVYGINNYQARLQDFANDGEPQYKFMLDDAERTLDEALAEAAPLLRGK